MQDIQHLKEAFFALPIAEKEAVFRELEWSLLKDLHERSLREDIAIAEERLARLDAGIDKPVPWEEVRRKLFRHT